MPPLADSAVADFKAPPRHTAFFLTAVLFVTALAFLPTLNYGFVYDDDVQVVSNSAIQSWSFLPSYFTASVWSFHDSAAASNYYRPLFYVWLRVNYALFGLRAPAWHLASLIVHLAATTLLFFVLRRHFPNPWIASSGALLFGVHPVHIESVAWVSGVTDGLTAVALLASLLLWLRAPGRQLTLTHLASLLCFGLALLIKETAAMFPAIILVYAAFRNRGSPERTSQSRAGAAVRAIRAAASFLAVTGLYFVARFAVLHGFRGGAPWVAFRVVALSWPSLLLFYVRHLLWPGGLSLFYDFHLVESPAALAFWFPAVVLAALALAGLYWWRARRERAAVSFAWFLLPLLPVLNIAWFQRDDFVHDRYLYLSVIGLSMAVGTLLETVLAEVRFPHLSQVAQAGVVVLALSFATVTAVQSGPWQDNLSLYTHAVRIAPRNTMARNNLAGQLAERGRYDEAATIFSSLVIERPDFWLANYNFGFVNYKLKRFDLAERYLLRAIALNPLDPDEYAYLGLTYFHLGRLMEAETQLRIAISRRPSGTGYHLALGLILLREGSPSAARAEFLEELRYHPDSEPARAQLAALDHSALRF